MCDGFFGSGSTIWLSCFKVLSMGSSSWTRIWSFSKPDSSSWIDRTASSVSSVEKFCDTISIEYFCPWSLFETSSQTFEPSLMSTSELPLLLSDGTIFTLDVGRDKIFNLSIFWGSSFWPPFSGCRKLEGGSFFMLLKSGSWPYILGSVCSTNWLKLPSLCSTLLSFPVFWGEVWNRFANSWSFRFQAVAS